MGFNGQVTEDGKLSDRPISSGTEPNKRSSIKRPRNAGRKCRRTDEQAGTPVRILRKRRSTCSGFVTELDRPVVGLVAIDTEKPQHENWKELIPEVQDGAEGVT